MRKLLILILSLALVLSACFALASCSAPDPEDDGEDDGCTTHVDSDGDGICDTEGCGAAVTPSPLPSGDYFNEDGELILFKGGTPTFQVVLGSDVGSLASDVSEIIEVLNSHSKGGVKSVNTSETAQDVEILIGTVNNRGDKYTIDKYSLGAKGYIVKQVGTKILVQGGSTTGLSSAITHLKENVFNIKKTTETFTNFVMASERNVEKIQSDYAIKSLTLAGVSAKNYVITYEKNNSTAKKIAESLADNLYSKVGIWVETYRTDKYEGTGKQIAIRTLENDGEGGGFYVYFDESDNLVMECEYGNKFMDLAEAFFDENIFSKKGKISIDESFEYTPDLRNVYYSDYGAIGDGLTDDFFAIAAAHADANANLLNVHADPDATYYIGNANGDNSIIVRTNTYWHGCKFIFDDSGVLYDTPGRSAPIFKVTPDTSSTSYSQSNSPIKTLQKGQGNVGWTPGYATMIIVYNNNVRHYIRYGLNQDNGQAQHELIVIDANGNVDPTTPIQWNYDVVTSMQVYPINDRAIEIKGEDENGKKTNIDTVFNQGPAAYHYYARNINITRSNVTLSGIDHTHSGYTPQKQGGHSSPYNGFTSVNYCANVTIQNMIFTHPESYNVVDANGVITNNNMGSYEMNASNSNNITWKDCTQSDFFEPDGGIKFHGMMGTNFCKNLMFDNMLSCSFDAHCGVYNATIKNSTCEHLNFIGDGLIKYENVTVYVDATLCAIKLRDDYGSTWAGDIDIDGLTLKYSNKMAASSVNRISIIRGSWTNWNFGYTTYLPQNISLKNVVMEKYSYAMVGGERVETHISYNQVPVRIISSEFEKSEDISKPNEMIGGSPNINPVVPIKHVTLETTYTGRYADLSIATPVSIIFPSTVAFKNMTATIDGINYNFSDLN